MVEYLNSINNSINNSVDFYILSNIIYMLVIIESLSAGLLISLINKYVINSNLIERCIAVQEDQYESEEASTVTVVADTDCTNHTIHVY